MVCLFEGNLSSTWFLRWESHKNFAIHFKPHVGRVPVALNCVGQVDHNKKCPSILKSDLPRRMFGVQIEGWHRVQMGTQHTDTATPAQYMKLSACTPEHILEVLYALRKSSCCQSLSRLLNTYSSSMTGWMWTAAMTLMGMEQLKLMNTRQLSFHAFCGQDFSKRIPSISPHSQLSPPSVHIYTNALAD